MSFQKKNPLNQMIPRAKIKEIAPNILRNAFFHFISIVIDKLLEFLLLFIDLLGFNDLFIATIRKTAFI